MESKTKSLPRSAVSNLAIGGVLSALVIVLQYLGSFIHFGPFSVSLVLLPIVLGATLTTPYISAWLGFLFSVVVLMQPDTAVFYAVSVPGTIVTVLIKGTLAGLFAGLVFKALQGRNRYIAAALAAMACPVVNTGLFLIGCRIFFFDTISVWGADAGYSSTFAYVFLSLVGANFLFELGVNVILTPVIVRIAAAIESKGK